MEEKGGFTDAGLKKQITVDMSAPVVGGIIPDRFSFDHVTHLYNSPPPHILDIDLLLMPFLEVKFNYKTFYRLIMTSS